MLLQKRTDKENSDKIATQLKASFSKKFSARS